VSIKVIFKNKFVLQKNTLYIYNDMAKEQSNKSETILVRVEPELKEVLQKMADKDNRKLSDFVRVQLMKLVESSNKKK